MSIYYNTTNAATKPTANMPPPEPAYQPTSHSTLFTTCDNHKHQEKKEKIPKKA